MSEFKYIKVNLEGEYKFEDNVKLETTYQLKRIADSLENLKIEQPKQENKGSKHDPATEKQKDLLKQNKVDFSENITKGEASDVIKGLIAKNKK